MQCYALATVAWVIGIACAAQRFPGNFDWAYTVISALASRKHNPAGAGWFAAAMVVAMILLWRALPRLTRASSARPVPPRWTTLALQIGVVGTALVGAERLVFFHFSNVLRKGHELVALVAFLGTYAGVIGLYVHRVRSGRGSRWPAILVLVPLVAVGLREAMLFLAQRDIGWADQDWRGRGTPLWFSFALWQWLAAVLLWSAIGHLLATTPRAAAAAREAAGSAAR